MQAQVVNPDELIRKVFASLQAKDEKAYLSLCPDSARLVQIMKRLAEGIIADIKADLPKDFSRSSMASLDKSLEPLRSSLQKTFSPTAIRRIRQNFRDEFRSIIKDGEKRGVAWEATAFANYTFDSIKNGSFLYNQSLSNHIGYQSMHGKIYFKDRDSTCQIWFRDMLFVPEDNKWYAGTLDMLVLEGDEVREVAAVHSIVVDEPPPPPPPTKKKRKSKTSSAKKKRPK